MTQHTVPLNQFSHGFTQIDKELWAACRVGERRVHHVDAKIMVGRSDDFLHMNDQNRFSDVIAEAFEATTIWSPRIFWDGETVTAWAPSCR